MDIETDAVAERVTELLGEAVPPKDAPRQAIERAARRRQSQHPGTGAAGPTLSPVPVAGGGGTREHLRGAAGPDCQRAGAACAKPDSRSLRPGFSWISLRAL